MSIVRSMLAGVSRVGPLQAQRRFKKGESKGMSKTSTKGTGVNNTVMEIPKWSYDLRMQIRSDEWKRRALRNHHPEVWLKNVNWVESLESFTVDPEYHWEYYKQAHRQFLYNHPEDYTNFIDEVLEHVELRPELWVPRVLRVFQDLKTRYGVSQRQYTSLIQIYGKARFLSKAEEAFKEIGKNKLPYNKDNYLAMCRAYILCRAQITEETAAANCKKLYNEALVKGIIMPEYVTGLSFNRFYKQLKEIGSELDHKERKALKKEDKCGLHLKMWDNKTLYHNIKYVKFYTLFFFFFFNCEKQINKHNQHSRRPKPRTPREWLFFGHPLNRVQATEIDYKGVKKGEPYYHQSWEKYGYPNQVCSLDFVECYFKTTFTSTLQHFNRFDG